MNEIDLSEKLKQLEAEVDKEASIQNETRQRIWDEMTGSNTYAGSTSGSRTSVTPASASSASSAPKLTLEDINAPVIT